MRYLIKQLALIIPSLLIIVLVNKNKLIFHQPINNTRDIAVMLVTVGSICLLLEGVKNLIHNYGNRNKLV